MIHSLPRIRPMRQLGVSTAAVMALAMLPAPAAAERIVDRLNFGSHVLGSAGSSLDRYLVNDDIEPVTLGQLTTSGSDLFSLQADGCSNTTLAPDQGCPFSVRFNPARGSYSGKGAPSTHSNTFGRVLVPDGSSIGPLVVTLAARVLMPGRIMRRTTADGVFGYAPTGREGRVLRFWLDARGDSGAAVGKLALTGPGAANFAIREDTCSSRIVTPGSGCYYDVVFRPVRRGSHEASVVVPGWDPSATTKLLGTGRRSVRAKLRLLARQVAARITARRLSRGIAGGSVFMGSHYLPVDGTLQATLKLLGAGRGERTLARSRPRPFRDGYNGTLYGIPRSGAKKALRRAGKRPKLVVTVTLVESTGQRTVTTARFRPR